MRQRCIAALREVFASFGFVPIDTPTLEYQDVLLGAEAAAGKGDDAHETQKQLYAFEDNGGRAVALRFDLTVPFARYASVRRQDLPRPFNRYQIGKVFRGENAQRGRYREFIQCDFDIVGADNPYADATIVLVMNRALEAAEQTARDALGLPSHDVKPRYRIHISHRGIMNALLERAGCRDRATAVLRIMDKLRKIPRAAVLDELAAHMSREAAEELAAACAPPQDAEQKPFAALEKLRGLIGSSEEGEAACARLEAVARIAQSCCRAARVVIDPSIMRGLDYYTGFVCESFALGAEDMGSVCSGGRYNNLAERFGSKELEGVGASVGLDRLLAVFETTIGSLGAASPRASSHTLLYGQTPACAEAAFLLLSALHQQNISAEVFSAHEGQGLKHVFKYAEKIGAKFLIIIGETELSKNAVTLKNLEARAQLDCIPLTKAIEQIGLWTKQ